MRSSITIYHSYITDAIRHTFRSLRHRNYRLFFTGQSVSLVGTWLHNTALTWLVYSMTHDARALGLMTFLSAVPVLLFGAFAGTVADEFPKRRILIITQSSAAVLALVLALAVWQGWQTLFLIGTVSALFGLTIAFDLPTRQAFVVELVGKEDAANAVALNSALFNAARLAGPAVAAAIIASSSIELCFLLNGISFLAVIYGLMRMKLPAEHHLPHKHNGKRLDAMREGIRYLYSIPNFRALMTLVIVMTLFAWSYTVNLPVIAVEVLKGNSSVYGALLASNGFGALIAALVQAAFGTRMQPRVIIFTSITTFVLSISTLPLLQSVGAVMICLVVVGWSLVTFFITANSTLQRYVPDHYRGRVMGIYSLIFAGFFPFGSLLAGFLTQSYGVIASLWFDGAVIAIVALPTYLFLRNKPRLADILKDRAELAAE